MMTESAVQFSAHPTRAANKNKSGMTSASSVPTLAAGAFFGDACQMVKTPSFQFAELEATVPEREVPRHTHNAPHFVLVLRGIYSTEARNQKGPCPSSTLIFNPAGTTHRDCFRSVRGKFLSISPVADAASFLERSTQVSQVVAGPTVRSLDNTLLAERIVREMRHGEHASAMVLEGMGLELIGRVTPDGRNESRFVPDWLLRTREMIEDCAGGEMAVADLAAEVEVHPVYLARAFRRHFGSSPGEYLRRSRLRRVQQLLAGTRLPLVEIALQCGFSDQSRMTHAFTSVFGMPPGRFRRLHLQ
jgi:AraC family transcriptional regulator